MAAPDSIRDIDFNLRPVVYLKYALEGCDVQMFLRR